MKWLLLVFIAACTIGATPVPTLSRLDSAMEWINGRVDAEDLKGRVVVIDVFTVDCSNCQNVVPTLRSLYAKYHDQGLIVVGVHSPETPAERSRAYVVQSLARQGIVWPVALDNDFSLWRAYGVSVWPTELFFDQRGRLRKVIIGDSQDREVRSAVESLLATER